MSFDEYMQTIHHDIWNVDNVPLGERWHEKMSFELIEKQARMYSLSPAFTFQLKSGENAPAKTLTWLQYRDLVAQTANGLRRLGIQEDDAVAVILPNALETAVIIHAGATSGIIAPINPLIRPEQISSILNEIKPKVVITLAPIPKVSIAQNVAAALANIPSVKTVLTVDLARYLSVPSRWLVPLLRPKVHWPNGVRVMDFNKFIKPQSTQLEFPLAQKDRVAALYHTGGTTGSPKLVQHMHSGMIYNGWAAGTLIFAPKDNIICPLPLFHVFASYPIMMGALYSGAHVIMPTPAGYRGDGVFENFWKLVARWKVHHMITVPTAIAKLLQTPVDADVSSLKSAISGSAPLPQGLFDRFEKETNIRILEGYGMTEATCLVSCNRREGERRIGSVGFPLPYCDVKIVKFMDGSDPKTCDFDEVGEICVKNPGVIPGDTYIEEDKNKNLFVFDGYLRTGDLGKFDKDGFLWITGRSKDLIIRGGHNIDPGIIEEALSSHPAVAFVGAIGQPDRYAGELPCAYVELVKGADVDMQGLIDYARERIPEDSAVPKYIEALDELPKTAVGKVFKPDLRKLAIKRVLSTICQNFDAVVLDVVEDSSRGLVVKIKPSTKTNRDALREEMQNFALQWDFV